LNRERVGQAAQTACLAPSREHLQCTQRQRTCMDRYKTTEQEDTVRYVNTTYVFIHVRYFMCG